MTVGTLVELQIPVLGVHGLPMFCDFSYTVSRATTQELVEKAG